MSATEVEAKVEVEEEGKVEGEEQVKVEVTAKTKTELDWSDDRDYVKLPLTELKDKFDLGCFWSAGTSLHVICKSSGNLSNSSWRLPPPCPMQQDGETGGCNPFGGDLKVFLFDGSLFGITQGCKDENLRLSIEAMRAQKRMGVETTIGLNIVYHDQLWDMIRTRDQQTFDTIMAERKCPLPLMNFDCGLIVPTTSCNLDWKRVWAGKGSLVGLNEAEVKLWVRDHLVAIHKIELEKFIGGKLSYPYPPPEELAALILGGCRPASTAPPTLSMAVKPGMQSLGVCLIEVNDGTVTSPIL